MTSIHVVVTFGIALFFAAISQAADPRESLDTAIAEGIRLLETKEYTTFVKEFTLPDDLKRITVSINLEQFVDGFAKKGATRMLAALNEIKGQMPRMENNGAQATYLLKAPTKGSVSINFTQVGKLWYISN